MTNGGRAELAFENTLVAPSELSPGKLAPDYITCGAPEIGRCAKRNCGMLTECAPTASFDTREVDEKTIYYLVLDVAADCLQSSRCRFYNLV